MQIDADKKRIFKVGYEIENFSNILLAIVILFIALACNIDGKIAKGNEVAAKVENFRDEKGRLPNSLTEIGIAETESGPIYYKKESESEYI